MEKETEKNIWKRKYLVKKKKTREEKEKDIWRKIIFLQRRRKTENDKEEYFLEGKYLVLGEEDKMRGKEGQILEKENIWSEEEKKKGEGKGGKQFEKKN